MKEKNVCNNCIISTGGCCTNPNLIIHGSEIGPFLEAKEKHKFPDEHTFDKLQDENDLYFYQANGNRCVFLSDHNSCLIYSRRPTVCKLYPVVWKNGIVESFNIYIDLLCPLTHTIPLVKIHSQSQEMDNQIMIKRIGGLIFDDNDNSYLNITDKKNSSEGLSAIYEQT